MNFLSQNKIKNNAINIDEINNIYSLQENTEVIIYGAIYKIRKIGGVTFINTRTNKYVVQCVYETSNLKYNINELSVEDCVEIVGYYTKEPRSNLGFEIHIKHIKLISKKSKDLPLEINNNKKIENLNLNTFLDNKIITMRNEKVRSIYKIESGILNGFRDYLIKNDFIEFVAPSIVSNCAEGGSELFKVDYFGKDCYLSQSPQMYKQIMLGTFQKVFTVGPVFRAEKFGTNRHINQFTGLDLEFAYIDSFEDIMILESKLICYIYNLLNEKYTNELKIATGKSSLDLPTCFPTMTFDEAKTLLKDNNQYDSIHINDLSSVEEQWLGNYILKKYNTPAVFITHYPTIKRPFYAMEDPKNHDVTLSFDLLLNGAEITTGGQRIHNYNELICKMDRFKMDISQYNSYLDLHRYGVPPHGGLGLGLERLTQKILNIDTIKKTSIFPRERDRILP